MKHGGGSIVLSIDQLELGKWFRIEGMMGGAKYRETVEENLFKSSRGFRLGQRFTFQQDNDPQHTAKATLGWLKGEMC